MDEVGWEVVEEGLAAAATDEGFDEEVEGGLEVGIDGGAGGAVLVAAAGAGGGGDVTTLPLPLPG